MNQLKINSALSGYAIFSTLYFAILYLYAHLKIQAAANILDSFLSNVAVSLDIMYFTCVFWYALVSLSGFNVIKKMVLNKRLPLDIHLTLFLTSSFVIAIHWCCNFLHPLELTGIA